MIVGRGLLARSFEALYENDHDVVIFASGVSNSLETGVDAFSRECRLLTDVLASNPPRLVYFGSCGVAEPSGPATPYMRHKRDMESLVVAHAGGLVLRLPQVVGMTSNPNTLTNYLRDRIVKGEHFTVWAKAERNLVDVDDIVAIAKTLISATPHRSTISIAAEHSVSMPDIIDIFERVLQRKANCTMEDLGSPLPIDSATAVEVAKDVGIDLGHGYAERVIRKYYAPH